MERNYYINPLQVYFHMSNMSNIYYFIFSETNIYQRKSNSYSPVCGHFLSWSQSNDVSELRSLGECNWAVVC